MAIFQQKVVKNKSIKIQISENDEDTIKKIKSELSELDQRLEFNIEDMLYDSLKSNIKAAQRELNKLKKEGEKQKI